MVVQHQFSHTVRHEQTAVDFRYIFRNINPRTFRVIRFLKRLRQIHIPQILMIMELQLLIHGNHFVYIDIAEMDPCPSHVLFLKCLQDACLFRPGRNGIIVSVKRHRLSRPADQIQLQDLIQHALMHVHRTRMQFMISLRLIHLRHFPAGTFRLPSPAYKLHVIFHDQLKPGLVHISQTVVPCRKCRSRPCKPSGKTLHLIRRHKHRNHLAQIREQCGVIQGQRHLRCRRPYMSQLDQQVVRINDRIFTFLREQPLRINGNVLVKRLILQDQIIDAFLRLFTSAASSGTSALLPEGGSRPRIADNHCGIQTSDIDSQLQRIRRDKS